jgi:hypothetical protein
VQRDPIGYRAGDLSLYRYVGNLPTNLTDFMGLQWPIGAGMGIPPFARPGGSFDKGGSKEPVSPPTSFFPKPGDVYQGGKNPSTFLGMENGWNNWIDPPNINDMNQECCNMASEQPNNSPGGHLGGNYYIWGLPSKTKYMGSGGAGPCVILVVKCDDFVFAHHYTVGQKPPIFKNYSGHPNCRAFVCGAGSDDPSYRGSRCLRKSIIDSVKKSGIPLDGVTTNSVCGWDNQNGGWYSVL